MRFFALSVAALAALFLCSCATDTKNVMIVSVAKQQMQLQHDGVPVVTYPISTSKFGLGDIPRSNKTPVGQMVVKKKIGGGLPPGAVLKSRKPTGEVLPPNAPGRDPIVTRILWLDGVEASTANAYNRYIYIHGTPEERTIGTASSYGCIRMRSADVIDLYDRVGRGARVFVVDDRFPDPAAAPASALPTSGVE
ncbi:MAG: L,D-transpeptidase [Verrucomicrobiota bacterium]